jgi:ppGpp synthetase/RelA/SpoT-type nucleotidyltranferase
VEATVIPPPADVPPLTEPLIEELVGRYRLEIARYDLAAKEVADRLRRELRAEARLRHVISYRAKHPEDLREKLRLKSGKAPYAIEALRHNLNDVVTDLGGCRVIVYSPDDEARVVDLIDRTFASPDRPDARPPPYQKETGYRASHRLVLASTSAEDLRIQGAVCEIQVTTVAAHLFNELEHDICYKQHGQKPTNEERAMLERIRRLGEVADEQVGRLLGVREAIQRAQEAITDAETLRFVLEHAVKRPLTGDFVRLHELLEQTLLPLTSQSLVTLGEPQQIVSRGEEVAQHLHIDDADDVIMFVLGLDQLRDDFVRRSASWRGPRTPLRRAIERWAAAAIDQAPPAA